VDLLDPTPAPAERVFRRYEEIRNRLPSAHFPDTAIETLTLLEAVGDCDGIVLDAFGVLNVGDTPIDGAVARMAQLRALGKRLCVLTNSASHTRAEALARYQRLGFDFTRDEVVSSRDVAAARLEDVAPGATWAAIAAPGDSMADIPARVVDAMKVAGSLESADAILFLSTAQWNGAWQDRLLAALERHPRPVVVANPDLVAPREGGLSLEPGHYAHDLIDRLGLPVRFFGKPFGEAFADVALAIGMAPARLIMVGDTLHTDVLGGAAAGMKTVLVARHGLFAGHTVGDYISRSGIVPNVIAAKT